MGGGREEAADRGLYRPGRRKEHLEWWSEDVEKRRQVCVGVDSRTYAAGDVIKGLVAVKGGFPSMRVVLRGEIVTKNSEVRKFVGEGSSWQHVANLQRETLAECEAELNNKTNGDSAAEFVAFEVRVPLDAAASVPRIPVAGDERGSLHWFVEVWIAGRAAHRVVVDVAGRVHLDRVRETACVRMCVLWRLRADATLESERVAAAPRLAYSVKSAFAVASVVVSLVERVVFRPRRRSDLATARLRKRDPRVLTRVLATWTRPVEKTADKTMKPKDRDRVVASSPSSFEVEDAFDLTPPGGSKQGWTTSFSAATLELTHTLQLSVQLAASSWGGVSPRRVLRLPIRLFRTSAEPRPLDFFIYASHRHKDHVPPSFRAQAPYHQLAAAATGGEELFFL